MYVVLLFKEAFLNLRGCVHRSTFTPSENAAFCPTLSICPLWAPGRMRKTQAAFQLKKTMCFRWNQLKKHTVRYKS